MEGKREILERNREEERDIREEQRGRERYQRGTESKKDKLYSNGEQERARKRNKRVRKRNQRARKEQKAVEESKRDIYGDSKSKLYIDRESKRGHKKVRENEKEIEIIVRGTRKLQKEGERIVSLRYLRVQNFATVQNS